MSIESGTLDALVPGSSLTASLATYYTVPANTKVFLKHINLCSDDGASRVVTIHCILAAGSASTANKRFQITVGANDFEDIDTGIVMNAGDFIQAKTSSGTSISMHISGITITQVS